MYLPYLSFCIINQYCLYLHEKYQHGSGVVSRPGKISKGFSLAYGRAKSPMNACFYTSFPRYRAISMQHISIYDFQMIFDLDKIVYVSFNNLLKRIPK